MRAFGAFVGGAALTAVAMMGCGGSGGDTSGSGGHAGSANHTSGSGGHSTTTTTTTSTASGGGATTSSSTGGGDVFKSAGCGKTGAAKGVQNLSIESNGSRTYVLSVPDDYDANKPLALVFGWHGIGGNGSGIRPYLGLEKPAAGQAIFVYADAIPQASEGGQIGWDLKADGVDVALFDALLSSVEDAYCVHTDRVFSTGYSHGGYMSNLLGCVRGDKLRGIAPIAGGGPYSGSCKGPLAAMVIHGSADQTVVLDNGVKSRDYWLKADGCGTTSAPSDPAPCVSYADCSAGHPVAWCQHDGAHIVPDFAHEGVWAFFASL
ncbi:Hypothetical protein A7982_01632 [Minicystis rosea]|nr:Hypothetical protein A7982_01632 [Minicystis rosea]